MNNNQKVINTSDANIPSDIQNNMIDGWEGLTKNQKILIHVNKLLKKANSREYKNIKKNNKILYEQKLREDFPEMEKFYPSLFRMIIDDPRNFNLNKLKNMLSMKDKIENKEVTYDTANKSIGLEYYNEYVKPKVDKIDTSDKKTKNNDFKNLYKNLDK